MSFGNALFSMACLYGAVFVLYGMLSIQRGAFHERKKKLVNLYGHPIEEQSGSTRTRFLKAFCLRPTFITGVITALVIIRWYNQPELSILMSTLFAAYMMSIIRSLETKFIPGAVIFCSVVYGTMHLIGYMNGWNPNVIPKGAASVAGDDIAFLNTDASSLPKSD